VAQQAKAAIIFQDQATTEFRSFAVPLIPTIHVLYISISDTATVDVSIRDGVGSFIGVKQVTSDAVIRLGIPFTELGVNVSAISAGTVTVTYRGIVVEAIPDAIIETFILGVVEPQTFIALTQPQTPDTWKLVYQGQLTTTITSLYTVPASTQSVLSYILASNTTGSDATFELYQNGSAAANNILPPSTVVAGGYAEFTGDGPRLAAAETLQGKASTATAITLSVYAKEQATA
jgi:hypothetical protein